MYQLGEKLHLDFETRSVVDLRKHGLMRYVRHESTEAIMLAWAYDDEEPEVWQPLIEPMPPRLRVGLQNAAIEKHAWNANFERMVFKFVLKFAVLGKWRDTMVQARYLAFPGELFKVSGILNLGSMGKMASGKKFINTFCKPRVEKTRTADKPHLFNDWTTHPVEWSDGIEYCKFDVISEREIGRRLSMYPMPEFEWDNWDVDQKINLEGLPVNPLFAKRAIEIAERHKDIIKKELKDRTGLANPLSQKQFLDWAQDEGYERGNLRKKTVEKDVENRKNSRGEFDEDEENEWLEQTLQLRVDASQTSHTKFRAIVDKAFDNKIFFAFIFYGAQRTGRYSGGGFQPHNLKRTPKKIKALLEEIIWRITEGDYDWLVKTFAKLHDEKKRASPLEIVSGAIRSVIQADEDRQLIVSDLNAIENRVLGWLANCQPILDVFRQKKDPYLAFATQMYDRPYESFNKSDPERDIAKPAVLGCGYALSGGELEKDKNGDEIKTGLWGYAEGMGVQMTREQAHTAVLKWRANHPEVLDFWNALEDAAHKAVSYGQKVKVGHLTFDRVPGFMRIRLPSGRHLYYYKPKYVEKVFQSKTETVVVEVDGVLTRVPATYTRRVLSYEGVNQITKQWGRVTTHAGKLAENVTQAVARDVLQVGIRRADRDGFNICGHVHDEIIAHELLTNTYHTLARLTKLMSEPIAWAPGLPLEAHGYESWYYLKD